MSCIEAHPQRRPGPSTLHCAEVRPYSGAVHRQEESSVDSRTSDANEGHRSPRVVCHPQFLHAASESLRWANRRLMAVDTLTATKTEGCSQCQAQWGGLTIYYRRTRFPSSRESSLVNSGLPDGEGDYLVATFPIGICMEQPNIVPYTGAGTALTPSDPLTASNAPPSGFLQMRWVFVVVVVAAVIAGCGSQTRTVTVT
jgi:hypothetical protein